MKTPNNKNIEQCRQIAADLKWNETHAEASARILVSKAVWLGIETEQVVRIICDLPGADYVRQNVHVLLQAASAVVRTTYYLTHPTDSLELWLNGELN